jgi:hypothetical protein
LFLRNIKAFRIAGPDVNSTEGCALFSGEQAKGMLGLYTSANAKGWPCSDVQSQPSVCPDLWSIVLEAINRCRPTSCTNKAGQPYYIIHYTIRTYSTFSIYA